MLATGTVPSEDSVAASTMKPVSSTGARPAEQRGAPRLLMGAGEYEHRLAPFQEARPDAAARLECLRRGRHIENAREMAERLRPLGVATVVEDFPGETHMSILPPAINRAIRFALGPEAG